MKNTWTIELFIVLVVFSNSLLYANDSPQLFFSVTTEPDYNHLITHEKGWTGADGAYSIGLSDSVTLWLYGDTWIGDIINGRHANATMVNNTLSLQYGNDPKTARMDFYWGNDSSGKTTAFFIPEDTTSWFWPSDGILTGGKLYICASQIKHVKENSDSAFNFKGVGSWLIEISNPQDTPVKWQSKQYQIPFGRFAGTNNLLFGTPPFLQEGPYIYVYGYQEKSKRMVYRKVFGGGSGTS